MRFARRVVRISAVRRLIDGMEVRNGKCHDTGDGRGK